jgi:TorA maturation chaperone TorD
MSESSDKASSSCKAAPELAFVGSTLGPLFLCDPEQGACAPVFAAIEQLDAEAAAKDWPFVRSEQALQAIEAMQLGLSGNRDDLLWEYRRLFAIGPAPKPAPPWGSYYTDREGAICSQATLELRRWLAEKGIGTAEEGAKAEDHIGQMLMLMAWIAGNRPELLSEFLAKHLLPWSGHVLAAIAAASANPFYNGLARLADASLSGAGQELELEVEYPRFYR